MRFLVTGGRKFNDSAMVVSALCELPKDAVLIHGGAGGADSLAAWYWSGVRGHSSIAMNANWPMCEGANCRPEHRRKNKQGKEYCPTAGHLRNQRMIDSAVELLIAFPGNNGTKDCIERALKAGVPVIDATTGKRIEA